MKSKIGNFKPVKKFFLAPMLEPNDIAFRLLCKKAGCGLTYTGMVNPQTRQKVFTYDKPALQIFCTTTKGLREFIKKYEKKVSLFDFNLGCPSTLAERLKFGSFMHKNYEKILEIVKTMRESTKKPITIKIRKSEHAMEIIKILSEHIDAVCIHPRTQGQGYSGEPDLKFALEIKKQIKLPIIYSGNVNLKNAKELLKSFDFVMLGREAIGNPSVFYALSGKNKKITFKDYLKLAHKYKIHFRQIKYQAMCFTKGMENATNLRKEISGATTSVEIEKILGIE